MLTLFVGVNQDCLSQQLEKYSAAGNITALNTLRDVVSISMTGDLRTYFLLSCLLCPLTHLRRSCCVRPPQHDDVRSQCQVGLRKWPGMLSLHFQRASFVLTFSLFSFSSLLTTDALWSSTCRLSLLKSCKRFTTRIRIKATMSFFSPSC